MKRQITLQRGAAIAACIAVCRGYGAAPPAVTDDRPPKAGASRPALPASFVIVGIAACVVLLAHFTCWYLRPSTAVVGAYAVYFLVRAGRAYARTGPRALAALLMLAFAGTACAQTALVEVERPATWSDDGGLIPDFVPLYYRVHYERGDTVTTNAPAAESGPTLDPWGLVPVPIVWPGRYTFVARAAWTNAPGEWSGLSPTVTTNVILRPHAPPRIRIQTRKQD